MHDAWHYGRVRTARTLSLRSTVRLRLRPHAPSAAELSGHSVIKHVRYRGQITALGSVQLCPHSLTNPAPPPSRSARRALRFASSASSSSDIFRINLPPSPHIRPPPHTFHTEVRTRDRICTRHGAVCSAGLTPSFLNPSSL